jgi:hypothetical protein
MLGVTARLLSELWLPEHTLITTQSVYDYCENIHKNLIMLLLAGVMTSYYPVEMPGILWLIRVLEVFY